MINAELVFKILDSQNIIYEEDFIPFHFIPKGLCIIGYSAHIEYIKTSDKNSPREYAILGEFDIEKFLENKIYLRRRDGIILNQNKVVLHLVKYKDPYDILNRMDLIDDQIIIYNNKVYYTESYKLCKKYGILPIVYEKLNRSSCSKILNIYKNIWIIPLNGIFDYNNIHLLDCDLSHINIKHYLGDEDFLDTMFNVLIFPMDYQKVPNLTSKEKDFLKTVELKKPPPLQIVDKPLSFPYKETELYEIYNPIWNEKRFNDQDMPSIYYELNNILKDIGFIQDINNIILYYLSLLYFEDRINYMRTFYNFKPNYNLPFDVVVQDEKKDNNLDYLDLAITRWTFI